MALINLIRDPHPHTLCPLAQELYLNSVLSVHCLSSALGMHFFSIVLVLSGYYHLQTACLVSFQVSVVWVFWALSELCLTCLLLLNHTLTAGLFSGFILDLYLCHNLLDNLDT